MSLRDVLYCVLILIVYTAIIWVTFKWLGEAIQPIPQQFLIAIETD